MSNFNRNNMNHKKQFTIPQIEVEEISGADLICTSLRRYDDEADFAGARGSVFDDFDE